MDQSKIQSIYYGDVVFADMRVDREPHPMDGVLSSGESILPAVSISLSTSPIWPHQIWGNAEAFAANPLNQTPKSSAGGTLTDPDARDVNVSSRWFRGWGSANGAGLCTRTGGTDRTGGTGLCASAVMSG